MENRTLRISPNIVGLEYQYEVCTKKILGICTRKKMVVDTYDFNDKNIRQKLIDMGFVVRVDREK